MRWHENFTDHILQKYVQSWGRAAEGHNKSIEYDVVLPTPFNDFIWLCFNANCKVVLLNISPAPRNIMLWSHPSTIKHRFQIQGTFQAKSFLLSINQALLWQHLWPILIYSAMRFAVSNTQQKLTSTPDTQPLRWRSATETTVFHIRISKNSFLFFSFIGSVDAISTISSSKLIQIMVYFLTHKWREFKFLLTSGK